MLPTCLSRHMRGSGFDGLPTAFDIFRQRHARYRRRACVTPFGSMVLDRSHEALRLKKNQHEKHCQRQVWWSFKTLKLRPFGRTSSTGPHTSGCRPFEINTFPHCPHPNCRFWARLRPACSIWICWMLIDCQMLSAFMPELHRCKLFL